MEEKSIGGKLKIHKFKILSGILGVFVFVAAVLGAYKFGQRLIYPEPVKGPTPSSAAVAIYSPGQLTEEEKRYLGDAYWPKLKPFSSGDKNREVYLVDCGVINEEPGVKLEATVTSVPNVPDIAKVTLEELMRRHYGDFPDQQQIKDYERLTGIKFNHEDSGINGVILKQNGLLVINFYDSVAAYGGGSSRVGCMSMTVRYTVKQFQTVKDFEMCIERYAEKSGDCYMDFQP